MVLKKIDNSLELINMFFNSSNELSQVSENRTLISQIDSSISISNEEDKGETNYNGQNNNPFSNQTNEQENFYDHFYE